MSDQPQPPAVDPLAILLGAALAAARNDLEKQQAIACYQNIVQELRRLRQELGRDEARGDHTHA